MTKDVIYVGPLSAVDDTVTRSGVSHLITLINDQTMIATPDAIHPDRHLRLAMNDIAEARPGMTLPGETHVDELIEFAGRWDREAPMLIHCWAGISRSTAAAFISLCVLNPDVDEDHIARELRAASPTATPNRRLIELADAAMGRDGRMRSAIAAIGQGRMTLEADLFMLPSRIAA